MKTSGLGGAFNTAAFVAELRGALGGTMEILTLTADPTITATPSLLGQEGTFEGDLYLHLTAASDTSWLNLSALAGGGGAGLSIPTVTDNPQNVATAGNFVYYLGCLYVHATTATDSDTAWIRALDLRTLLLKDPSVFALLVVDHDPTVTAPLINYVPGTVVKWTDGEPADHYYWKLGVAGNATDYFRLDNTQLWAFLMRLYKSGNGTNIEFYQAFEVDIMGRLGSIGSGSGSTFEIDGHDFPDGAQLTHVAAHVKIPFSAPALATMSVKLGDVSNATEDAVVKSFDGMDVAAGGNQGSLPVYRPVSRLRMTISATGDTLNNLTAGTITVFARYALP